jgi:hypothetical protein
VVFNVKAGDLDLNLFALGCIECPSAMGAAGIIARITGRGEVLCRVGHQVTATTLACKNKNISTF